jgi:hypothetical protein
MVAQARYLVEEAVRAALGRKEPTPEAEMGDQMGDHLLARYVLKSLE